MIGQTTLPRGNSWITSYALGYASRSSTPGLPMLRRSSCFMDFLSSHPTFDAVAAQLNAEGLRTLTPTQRGYSRTARPSRRRDYRTAATAADVIALLDTAGLAQAHVVGHDWGGNQAWGAAGWYPDRVASLTVLSTPHPAAFLKALRTSKQGLLSWYMALFQLPALPERVGGAYAREVIAGQRPARRVCRSLQPPR